MDENIRLVFSLVWFVALGCTFAGIFLVLFTWGAHWDFLLGSALALAASTGIIVATSLG